MKTVVIAAAGSGSRLGQGLPKCLISVGGHAIFEWQLKAFENFEEIRMVVGYKAEQVIEAVSAVSNKVKFIRNDEFANTTTLQSMWLGAQGLSGNAVFVDGDMLISKKSITDITDMLENGDEFIAISTDISEEPVYTGVKNGCVEWFSYEQKSGYEWANLASIQCDKLKNNHTHFYVQLEKYLPLKAVIIERLEIDTPSDREYAEKIIATKVDMFDFRGFEGDKNDL